MSKIDKIWAEIDNIKISAICDIFNLSSATRGSISNVHICCIYDHLVKKAKNKLKRMVML